mmetsp:Transcript_25806/g.80804  ORF Transcript_25806/g.80804 Transcript_25806/m.80804 type:complete len:488 (+) Transcript_25806:444-1907(+)
MAPRSRVPDWWSTKGGKIMSGSLPSWNCRVSAFASIVLFAQSGICLRPPRPRRWLPPVELKSSPRPAIIAADATGTPGMPATGCATMPPPAALYGSAYCSGGATEPESTLCDGLRAPAVDARGVMVYDVPGADAPCRFRGARAPPPGFFSTTAVEADAVPMAFARFAVRSRSADAYLRASASHACCLATLCTFRFASSSSNRLRARSSRIARCAARPSPSPPSGAGLGEVGAGAGAGGSCAMAAARASASALRFAASSSALRFAASSAWRRASASALARASASSLARAAASASAWALASASAWAFFACAAASASASAMASAAASACACAWTRAAAAICASELSVGTDADRGFRGGLSRRNDAKGFDDALLSPGLAAGSLPLLLPAPPPVLLLPPSVAAPLFGSAPLAMVISENLSVSVFLFGSNSGMLLCFWCRRLFVAEPLTRTGVLAFALGFGGVSWAAARLLLVAGLARTGVLEPALDFVVELV